MMLHQITFLPDNAWCRSGTPKEVEDKPLDYAYRDGDVMVLRYKDGTEKRI